MLPAALPRPGPTGISCSLVYNQSDNIYEYEIPIDFSFQYWRSVKSHFVGGVRGFLGAGFIYAGFAWDYLGMMAWSDFGSLIVMLPTFGFFVPAFGFSTVEQIHISKDILNSLIR